MVFCRQLGLNRDRLSRGGEWDLPFLKDSEASTLLQRRGEIHLTKKENHIFMTNIANMSLNKLHRGVGLQPTGRRHLLSLWAITERKDAAGGRPSGYGFL